MSGWGGSKFTLGLDAIEPADRRRERAESARRRPGQAARRPTTQRSIDRLAQDPRRGTRVEGLGQVTHNDEMADTAIRQSRDLLRGHAACHEDRNTGACTGPSDVAQSGAGTPGLGRCRLHGPRRDVGDRLVRRALEVGRTVRRQPDDGVGTQDAPGQRDRRVVLAHVDAVRPRLEREVGPVVQHEGHAVVPAHRRRHLGPGQQRLGLELLVAQLDHVHAARDALAEERGQVRPVRRAEVEAALGEVGPRGHAPARALAFIAFLVALTLARLSGSVMSATERELPSLP